MAVRRKTRSAPVKNDPTRSALHSGVFLGRYSIEYFARGNYILSLIERRVEAGSMISIA
jgi:hypothetical protein